MKMNEKYEEQMWGQIDILHQKSRRQYTSFSYFIDMLNKFQDACNDFSKNIQIILGKSHEIIEYHSTTIYTAADKFVQLFESFSKEFKELQNSIKKEIIDKIYKPTCDIFNRENDFYSNYNDLRKQYNNSKAKMEKFYKNYINGMKLCENLIFNSKQMDSMIYAGENEKKANLKNANNSIKNTKPIEEKYFSSVEKVNKDRENEIKFQKDLLQFYQKLDFNFYDKIKMAIGLYLASINKMANSILSSSEFLGNAFQRINIEKDIKDYISKNKVEKKIQQKSIFIPYKPFSDPLNQKEDAKKLDIYFEVIKTLKSNFREIRNDINMEEEQKRKRLRYLCERIFKIGSNINFSKEEKKELLEFLEIPSFKKYFILVLTKQRTKGRFKRSESLVKDLSELLLKILEIAEKEKDYESAKNCIILSQTYYFEEKIEDKKEDKRKKDNKDNNKIEAPKKYLFELIKSSRWLTSYEFWDGLNSMMIESEINKNKENSAKQGIEETEKLMQSRQSNICFSQLLTSSSNMMEFGMSKENTIKIVTNYAQKYGVAKELCDTIYANIDMKQQEIDLNLNKEKIENKDINELMKNNEDKDINSDEKKEVVEEKKINKNEQNDEDKKNEEKNTNEIEQKNEEKKEEEKNNEENKKDEIKENNDDKKEDDKVMEENKKLQDNKDIEDNKVIKEIKKNEENNIIEEKNLEENKETEKDKKNEEKLEEKINEENKEINENNETKENNLNEENEKIEESKVKQENKIIDENKEIEEDENKEIEDNKKIEENKNEENKNEENINDKENINKQTEENIIKEDKNEISKEEIKDNNDLNEIQNKEENISIKENQEVKEDNKKEGNDNKNEEDSKDTNIKSEENKDNE